MEVSRGANLVGMSMIPLDVCPHSLLIKKKKNWRGNKARGNEKQEHGEKDLNQ
jgi:hypothetical protein